MQPGLLSPAQVPDVGRALGEVTLAGANHLISNLQQ